uniref:Uncharacterized protein n=1 Tax=Salix viminalis TaxID=40686 RepID=A0A6N2KFZ9_SALVM
MEFQLQISLTSFLYKAVWMLSNIKSKTKSIQFPSPRETKILKMAGLALTTSLPRYGRQLGAMIATNQRSSGVFVPLTRRFQASCRKEASSGGFEMARKDTKEGINEAKAAGETVVDEVTQKTKEVAGKASEASNDLAEKAKQTAQDAWGAVKDTTTKIKDKVVGKAEESKEIRQRKCRDSEAQHEHQKLIISYKTFSYVVSLI